MKGSEAGSREPTRFASAKGGNGGLDPDITPSDALAQIPMVARATGLSDSVLKQLISRETQGAQLGFLGSTYINVLQLNEALHQLQK